VQTLNFKPFRVPLTPFAGVLSNGAIAHQIALSVYGANGYFSVAGALMLYLDHGGSQVTGSITQNTLAASPSPTVTNNIVTNNGVTSGTLDTTSQRNFTITGSLVTSTGSQTYTVNQVSNFVNDQKFKISDTVYDQIIKQATNTTVQTSLVQSGGTVNTAITLSYPLTVDYLETVQKNGNIAAHAIIGQDFQKDVVFESGNTEYTTTLDDGIDTTDTLVFNSSGNFIGHHGQASTATYATTSSTAPCFTRTLTAANNVLTSAKTGCKK
jgi:hypothetical protein